MRRLLAQCKVYWFLALFLALPALAARAPWDVAGSTFVVTIKEIEIGESLVRVTINQTLHGSGENQGCPENDTSFGWSLNHPNHNNWVNIVTTAYLAKAPVKIWQPAASTCGNQVGLQVKMVGFAEQR